MKPIPKSIPVGDQVLDGRGLADALGSRSTWLIYAVKKANKMLAARGEEELIFTGRYSTPGKISAWLELHPTFVANRVLAPQRKSCAPGPRKKWQGKSGRQSDYQRSVEALLGILRDRVTATELASALTIWRAVCQKRRLPTLTEKWTSYRLQPVC